MHRRMLLIVFGVLIVTVAYSERVQSYAVDSTPALQSSECTHYVDNQVSSDGDGSWSSPWRTISDHVDHLGPGDVMCVRGDVSTLGRAYYEGSIRLDPSSGISNGTATDPITVRPYPGEHVVIYPEDGDSLEFMGISYWHWEGITFDETDADPIKFDAAASHNVLRDCEVRNGGYAGIVIKNGNENTIEGCRLHGFSHKPGEDACAITIWDGRANVIRANEIYDFTADGIQIVLPGISSGTLIEDNHIYTTNGRCSENAVDIKSNGEQEQTVIRNNVMHGFRKTDTSCGGSGDIGPAIVLHGDADNILIERNEIYDANGALRVLYWKGERPDNIAFVNNLVHDMDDSSTTWISGFGVQISDASAVKIYHNTFVNVPGDVLYLKDSTDMWIRNNLFYNVGDGTREDLSGDIVIDYNGWFPTAVNDLTGPNDMVGLYPQFIDLGAGDYRPRPDGPAVDRGYSVGAPSNDFRGLSRPYGPGYDLGAFETHLPKNVRGLRAVEGQTAGDQITVTLTWMAPGQPGYAGTATAYHLRYSDEVITAETWEDAQPVTVPFSPSSPGTRESLVLTDLGWSEETIYFAMRTTDAGDNWSDLSQLAFYPSYDVYLPLILRDWS